MVRSSAGDAGRVLQSGANDLGRIDDAGGDQVAVLALVGVVALAFALHLLDAIDDDGAVDAGVLGDVAERAVRARCE